MNKLIKMSVNLEVDNDQNQYENPSDKRIYERNKELNKQRIGFFTFLMNSTKGEMAFDEFQKVLFWNGILDIFLFFICFCLFLSLASQFWRNIFFVGHAIRGAVSLIILKYLPTTSSVIEALNNFENESLTAIHNKIYEQYKKLLEQNEKKIRPSMYTYWIITIIDFLIDVIVFFVLLHEWGDKDYNFRNIATLIIIVMLFGKLIIINILIFYYSFKFIYAFLVWPIKIFLTT